MAIPPTGKESIIDLIEEMLRESFQTKKQKSMIICLKTQEIKINFC